MVSPSLLHPLGERETCQGREVIVKINEAIYKQLRIACLWMKSNSAPLIYAS